MLLRTLLPALILVLASGLARAADLGALDRALADMVRTQAGESTDYAAELDRISTSLGLSGDPSEAAALRSRALFMRALDEITGSSYFASLTLGKAPAPEAVQVARNLLLAVQAQRQVEQRAASGGDLTGLSGAIYETLVRPLVERARKDEIYPLADPAEGRLAAQYLVAEGGTVTVYDLYAAESAQMIFWSIKAFPPSAIDLDKLVALAPPLAGTPPSTAPRLALYFDLSALREETKARLTTELARAASAATLVISDDSADRVSKCVDLGTSTALAKKTARLKPADTSKANPDPEATPEATPEVTLDDKEVAAITSGCRATILKGLRAKVAGRLLFVDLRRNIVIREAGLDEETATTAGSLAALGRYLEAHWP